jgi:hypothetical protein
MVVSHRQALLTHKIHFLTKKGLDPNSSHSIYELSRISGYSPLILHQVYNRGIGAYKTNPTSVRNNTTFQKGQNIPMKYKLSKEQWAMARVYSFLDGNPKHDNDLRRKTV